LYSPVAVAPSHRLRSGFQGVDFAAAGLPFAGSVPFSFWEGRAIEEHP